MNLLFDTNIIIYLAKDQSLSLLKQINPDNQKIFVSVASIGELKSIALQNKWGQRKLSLLEILLEEMLVVEINEVLTDTYSQIDAYSQHRNSSFTEYSFISARNMGKNDIWIAATAALLSLKLVTADNDFDHLHGVFFDLQKLKPADIK